MRSNRSRARGQGRPAGTVMPGSLWSRHTSLGYSISQPVPSRSASSASRASIRNRADSPAWEPALRRHCCSGQVQQGGDPDRLDVPDSRHDQAWSGSAGAGIVPALQCVLNLQFQLRGKVLEVDAGGSDELAVGDEPGGVGPAMPLPPVVVARAEELRRIRDPEAAERQPALGRRGVAPGPGQAHPRWPDPVCRPGSTGRGAWSTARSWHCVRSGSRPRRREPATCGPGPAGRDRRGSPPSAGGPACGTGWHVRCTARAGSTPPSGRSPRPRTRRRRRRDRPGQGCRPRCEIPAGR